MPFEWAVCLPPAQPTKDAQAVPEPFINEEGVHLYPIPHPVDDTRHTSLGRFLDRWGKLEMTTTALLSRLFFVDHQKAAVISDAVGTRQLIDMLDSLASATLPDEKARELANLNERLKTLNTQRNKLVHGQWVLESIIDVVANKPRVRSRVYRKASSTNPGLEKRLEDIKNQKDRGNYMFTCKVIDGLSGAIRNLHNDYVSFMKLNLPNDNSKQAAG